jgi:hypothetical protein
MLVEGRGVWHHGTSRSHGMDRKYSRRIDPPGCLNYGEVHSNITSMLLTFYNFLLKTNFGNGSTMGMLLLLTAVLVNKWWWCLGSSQALANSKILAHSCCRIR